MLKTYEINLDVERDLYSPSNLLFSVSRNDLESIELQFIISQDENRFNLTGATVELAIKKPSGLTVYQTCEITNELSGEAKTILSLQGYVEYGVHTAELHIRNVTQMIVASPFYYMSNEAVMVTEEVESINDWSALQEALFAYDLKPVLVTGIPDFVPEYIGQVAFDTGNNRAFIAYDLTGTGWQILGAGEGGTAIVAWADILGKPSTYPPENHMHNIAAIDGLQAALDSKADAGAIAEPSAHTHEIADVNGLQSALNSKAPVLHTHGWVDISGKPTAFTPTAHGHTIADVTNLQTTLDAKSDDGHTHGWTEITGKPTTFTPATHSHGWTEITGKPTAFTPTAHSHAISEITNLQSSLDAKADDGHTHLWADITDKPLTFTPPAEYLTQTEADARYALQGSEGGTVEPASWGTITGLIADQTDLQTALDAKANTSHSHTIAQVTGLQTALDAKADDGHTHGWTEITGKPATFTPTAHTHLWADVTDKPTTFAPTAHTHLWADITDKPTTFAPSAHTHAIADVTGLQTALDGKADDADLAAKADAADVYTKLETYSKGEVYNKTEIDQMTMGEGGGSPIIVEDNLASTSPTNALSANQGRVLNTTKADVNHNHDTVYAPIAHSHAIGDITGLQTALDGKADDADLAAKADATHTHLWADITDKPTTFTPASHTHLWADITDKPTTFTPATHTHGWTEITGKPATFTPTAHTHLWADITDKPTTFTPASHTHAISGVTGLQTALDAKADEGHTHLWADITDKPTTFAPSAHTHAWTEITGKPTTFTPSAHTHAIADVTNLQTTLDGKSDEGHTHLWADITDKPTTFAPTAHNHAWTEITGKPVTYPADTHYHAIADVTGLQTALDGKADDADLAGLQPKPVVSGSVPALPTITPTHTGQMVVDNVQKRTFIAEGTTTADWKRLAGTNYVDAADNVIKNDILGGRKIWAGTQTDYNNIATKDTNTLYFITS